jgi:hypothetical protein
LEASVVNVPNLGIPDIRGDLNNQLGQIAVRTGLPVSLLAGSLIGPDGLPSTRARLSHAYTLRTARGSVVGAVFRTEVRQARNVEKEYEVDKDAHGEIADLVPQEMTEQSFSVARFDLYTDLMEEAFTDFELVKLTDQRAGFQLREIWRAPTSVLNSRGKRYNYKPVFFESLGREVSTESDRVVRVNAQLVWLDRIKVQG